MSKLVRYKTFFHLPRNETNTTMNSHKGASATRIKKLKLRPNAWKFFAPIMEHNKQIWNNMKREQVIQDKTIQALSGLASMASLKGAPAYPRACNSNKMEKNTALALKNLRRMING